MQDGFYLVLNRLRNNDITLRSVDFSDSNLSDLQAIQIADALEYNNVVTKVDLSCNDISDSGCVKIASMMQSNKSIIELNLSQNSISVKSANAIYNMLRFNNKLQKLNLFDNDLADEGLEKISFGLYANTSIISINVSFNSSGQKVGIMFSAAIFANDNILDVSVHCLPIESEKILADRKELLMRSCVILKNCYSGKIRCQLDSKFLAKILYVGNQADMFNASEEYWLRSIVVNQESMTIGH